MTMTDTEAKALALELLNTVRDSRGLPAATMEDADGISWFEALCCAIEREASIQALCRAIEREAATEARHAAELREQAEQFSEAVKRLPKHIQHNFRLAPFILPAPDPLVELAREMTLLDGVVRTDNQKAAIREGRAGNTASDDFYDRLRTALASRQYEVRKIGEAK